MCSLLGAALYHHGQGCAVLAVSEKKVPYHKGWDRWFSEPQTEQEVREEFANGAYGLGLLMWPGSQYTVLDFDGGHAEATWQATGIELPETAKNYTRSGWFHLIFRMPAEGVPGLKRKIRLVRADCDCKDTDDKPKPCGVDLLVNGFACFPPTPGYREDLDHSLEDAVPLPLDVIEFAQKHQESRPRGATGAVSGRVHHGERHSTLVSLAGTMRNRGMSIEAIRAALKADNENRFDPPVGDAEIEDILKSAGGWEQGAAKPKPCTDLGNAERLVQQHRVDIRYVPQLRWLVWDGRRWVVDETGEIERKAKVTVRSIYMEATNCEDKEVREALSKWAHKSEAVARIAAMIELAKSEQDIPIPHKELDRDLWLLNVLNGTLDLKNIELRKHCPGDFLTKLIEIDYDASASCLTWESFVERVTACKNDQHPFIQKSIGYALTGSTREQCLFILYGVGANGKSTFLNVISSLLADYGKQTPTETLLVKRGDQIPNDIARLAGSRFVCAVEATSGRRLAEGLVKQMTGGDKMTARFLHREFFEFEPTFKLWLAVNHKPRITGTDHAIWRRIRLIPFNVTIPKNEQDPDLFDKLKAELPGILAWAVEGCKLWLKEGLVQPQAVETATEEYRTESDIIATFIDERCEVDQDGQATKNDLYLAYTDWCKDSGERPVTKNELRTKLIEKGFSEDRSNKGRYWKGLKL